jgi:hypothetical protein
VTDMYIDVGAIDEPHAVTVRLSDVKPEVVCWVWSGKKDRDDPGRRLVIPIKNNLGKIIWVWRIAS